MKKFANLDYNAIMNQQYPSYGNMEAYLNNHIDTEHQDSKLQDNGLLAAGTGALVGTGGLAGKSYLDGQKEHLARIEKVTDKAINSGIAPYKELAEGKTLKSKAQKLWNSANAGATAKAYEVNKANLSEYLKRRLDKSVVRGAGVDAIKKMPLKNIGMAGAGGATLAFLANKLLNQKKNEGEA